MSLKSKASKIFAKWVVAQTQKWAARPVETQDKVFKNLIQTARKTRFGKDHDFGNIRSHQDFIKRVPVRDYEALKPYVEQVVAGEKNILWPGKPLYFAKTSGTTSGAKYIPITKKSMPFHIEAARNAILTYIHETGNSDFVDGKMIFLQGSPEMKETNGIKTGRLSGIAAHYVPGYLQKNRLPSWETNCIEDWEEKVNAIVKETKDERMTVISGIPSWVQMYFEKLRQETNKNIGELFPDFNLFIYGGVNYEPYRSRFEKLIGRKVDSIELYPASEGFFAYQDSREEEGMLLLLNSGIFYEFIPADLFFDDYPPRLTISQVETGKNYVMIISTNAGLWAYNLGDTIQFTSLDPFRIVVSGRIKHFISAFGEHVIGKEVEEAMNKAIKKFGFSIAEFTVAPLVNPEKEELPHHQWLIEFDQVPSSISEIAGFLDKEMQRQNMYYADLIEGKILQPLKIIPLKPESFRKYMKSRGKLGGQNKIPRLTNTRELAENLLKIQA